MEIKGRVWDAMRGQMSYDITDLLVAIKNQQACDASGNKIFFPQLATGMEDAQGKTIYEGDICDGEYAGSSVGIYRNAIRWSETEHGFSFAGSPLWCWDYLKVVGNIYENPELLKSLS